MNTPITAILLAGGDSTRFWPFTDKVTLSFLGKPLISRHIEQLIRLGIGRIIVITNARNKENVRQAVSSFPGPIDCAVQKGSGQGNALLSIKKLLADSRLLVLNASDVYEDKLLDDLIKLSNSAPTHGFLASIKTKTHFPGGYLLVSSEGTIREIVEKPSIGHEPSDVVRIVADIFPSSRVITEALESQKGNAPSGYEAAINTCIKSGLQCKPLITGDTWRKLKYPWHVLEVMEGFLSTVRGQQIAKSADIRKGVILEGPLLIEDGVKILENTKIVGPCFIGADTIIGNSNIIRESHIGSKCVTGFNTDITRSYIGNQCWFHSNYIGDSVLDTKVNMGSGSVLANLRLDEGEIYSTVKEERINTQKVKLGAMIGCNVGIGVNTSIMPGIKIGSNTLVGAGIVLDKDVSDESFCVRQDTLTVLANRHRQKDRERETFRRKI